MNIRIVALIACLGVSSAALSEDLLEFRCGIPLKSGGRFEFQLAMRAESDKVRFPSADEVSDPVVTCARSMLVPTANDAQVLQAGYKLLVASPAPATAAPRVALLAGEKPNIGFTVVTGEMTREERRRVKQAVRQLNR